MLRHNMKKFAKDFIKSGKNESEKIFLTDLEISSISKFYPDIMIKRHRQVQSNPYETGERWLCTLIKKKK